jgi:hypothetical protein
MKQRVLRRSLLVGMVLGVFVVGFFLGSVSQHRADAQLPGGIGKGAGGALGSVTELGSSIVEMQEHVDGLQKNLETLKKIQGALGGGR